MALGTVRRAALLLLVIAAGCGDDGVPPPDASVPGDADVIDGGGGPAEPAAPAAPVIGPCREGWRESSTETGLGWCDPWPSGGPIDCGGVEAHFPGTEGCAAVGTPCPPGEFPEVPSGTPTLYVRPGAIDGDGSMGAPFGTIGEATRRATNGTVIALAKGAHDGIVNLARAVTLRGACAAETLVTLTDGVPESVVIATAAGAAIRDLRIEATERAGITADGAGTELSLEGVVITGVRGWGIAAFGGATVEGEGVVVRDVSELPTRGGYGINSGYGGSVTLRNAVVERATGGGVAVFQEGSLVLEDAAVRDTRSLADGFLGMGIWLRGGTVDARRVALHGNRDHGLMAIDAGTSARLDQLVVQETRAPVAVPDYGGRGLGTIGGATIEVHRTVVDGYSDLGIVADEGEVTLEDVLVRNGRGTDDRMIYGFGVQSVQGGVVRGARLRIERASGAGVTIQPGGRMEMDDVVVLDTRSQVGDGIGGLGLHFAPSTSASLSRVLVERSRSVGVAVVGPDTDVRLEDLTVRDTESVEAYVDADGFTQRGILGRGLTVDVGANVEVLRARIENSREAGVLVQMGSVARFQHLLVDGVRERACVETDCPDQPGGTGIVVTDRAAVEIHGFAVRSSVLCGVQIAHFGGLDLHDGLVADHPVGACIQVDDYDVARLMDRVVYRDNGTNLDTTMLPVPGVDVP